RRVLPDRQRALHRLGLAMRAEPGEVAQCCGLRRVIHRRSSAVPGIFAASRSDRTPGDLLRLDRLEERPEVALAEPLVSLALDDLEENRPDHGLGEDLQQLVLAALPVHALAVDQ